MNRLSLGIVGLTLTGASLVAQQGTISGIVYDKDFDAPLPGVRVQAVGARLETTTTDTGNFAFNSIPPGTYTLIFSKVGYVEQVKSSVVVNPGEVREVNAWLAGDFTEMEEIVVQDILRLGGGSDAELMAIRFESPSFMNSISADSMRLAGVSDAAGALPLVAGTSVQDGKFAVVRGLPDRYVSSQVNGMRLPSADENTRAVELDQFPSAVLEAISVTKTFTPDQQGDASGGAVDVRLRGIPEEPLFFNFNAQHGYNSNIRSRNDFLSYEGGGINFSGKDDGFREPQAEGTNWLGAVGTSPRAAPTDYKFSFSSGGNHEFENGLRIGALGSFVYDRDNSFYNDGVDDSFWIRNPGEELSPQTIQGDPDQDEFKTQLFDVTEGSQSLQRGGLATAGAEWLGQTLEVAFLRTRTTQDRAVLAIDTRGKSDFFFPFFPGYDPDNIDHPGNQVDNLGAAPYIRNETLEYTERVVETTMYHGEHQIPTGELDLGLFEFVQPEFDWTHSRSTAQFNQPDKRLFGAIWQPRSLNPGAPPTVDPFFVPAQWQQLKPAANFTLGNLQRIYKEIEEDGESTALNLKLPFKQWDDHRGYFKFGVFEDKADRKFDQDTFANFGDEGSTFEAEFEQPWSRAFPSEDHPISASEVDIDYTGRQRINSWYLMMDLPLTSYLTVIGGVRFERTEIGITVDPEEDAGLYDPITQTIAEFPTNPDGSIRQTAPIKQRDKLPAASIVLTPRDDLTIRLAYSETVARQTFRELAPTIQQEFLGGPIFIGNPELRLSAVKNYDARIDYTPFEDGLFSVSYFEKHIDDPIEFVQRLAGFAFTTPQNLPDGELKGWEFEARQDLGQIYEPLSGFNIGGNLTLIDSEVSLSQEEIAVFESPVLDAPRTKRRASNAPKYLYNLNASYDFDYTGTRVGLFYTVTGDKLVTGAGESAGNLVPDVFAKEVDVLNLTVSQRLNEFITVRFQAKNLTNPDIQTEYRPLNASRRLNTSFTRGIDYSLSIGGSLSF